MVNKTKINKTAAAITDVAANTGILLMTAAVTLGMVEVPEHPDKRAIVPVRPAFAFANATAEREAQGNQLRRERDEVHPHYVGYSVNQRTPGRTGKI
jgi:hypothetical protein